MLEIPTGNNLPEMSGTSTLLTTVNKYKMLVGIEKVGRLAYQMKRLR